MEAKEEMDTQTALSSDCNMSETTTNDTIIEPPAETEGSGHYDFIPEIEVTSVHNGVIFMQITNCEDMWPKNRYESRQDVCFMFVYRRLNTNEHDTNKEADTAWRKRPILVGNCCYDGTLFLKLPVFLVDYDIEFFMQCRHSERDTFMRPSLHHTVNIASFLLNNTYKVGDLVSFRDDDTFHTTSGKIVECVDENKFKIQDYEHNEQHEADEKIEKHVVIDRSRVYHERTVMYYEVDLIEADQMEIMERNLLLCRSDTESQQVFHALLESYKPASLQYCYEHYDVAALVHWRPMSYFVSKCIFDFLFEPQFRYKVDCLIDGDNHHPLNLCNLLQSDIRTTLAMLQQKIGNVEEYVDTDAFTELNYSCDSCRTALSDWHFVCQCSTSPLCRHDFCLNCVNSAIELNKELRAYVDQILNEDLNDDCIQIIVSYVIGNVVCVEH